MTNRSMRRRVQLSARTALGWRPTGAALAGLSRSILTSFLALGVALYILPGRQSSGPLAVLGLVLVVVAVGTVLRPILLGLAVVVGSWGLLVVGILAQAIVLTVAIDLAPDVHLASFPRILLVAWVAAVVAAVVNWFLDSGSEDSYLAQVLGRCVHVANRVGGAPHTLGPGLLVIQLDGVGEALLRQAIVGGALPTLSRWLRTGTHEHHGWHTGLPATTPAGQAVLLHGDTHEVPSFRWYEKERRREVVANRPRDAAEIGARISDGRGLLADGGVSISNLFDGDAPTRILTMAEAQLPGRSTRGLATFATSGAGLARSIVVFVGQVITELYQGRRQRRRNVRPRVHRGAVFALLRGVTTALLRDVNVAIVAEQMARAAPVIFVDFVDYDEVAHHAGPSRPESIRTLDGLDRVLLFFERVAAEVGRDYEIVVVSDHGQAQGATFSQLAGQTLHELVESLVSAGAGSGELDAVPAERWGPVNLLLNAGGSGVAPRTLRAGTARSHRDPVVPAAAPPSLVVAAAGSLGHIYLPDVPGRADRDVIERSHPGLIAGLAAHPQIGAVMVRAGEDVRVIGARGWRNLVAGGATGGSGADPTAVYGPLAARDLADLDARAHVGDLVVLGRFDPRSGEVTAFEELVGSHGGLGGDQTCAVLIVPAGWPVPDHTPLHGIDVHRLLVDRLRELGLRPGDPRVVVAP